MAAPNIVNVTTITGKTTYHTPANTNALVIVANPVDSGKVFKINSILASNIDANVYIDSTVSINTADGGDGTSFPIANKIPVPANSTLVILDKTSSLYLEEDKSVVITSGTASKLTYVVSYEEIS